MVFEGASEAWDNEEIYNAVVKLPSLWKLTLIGNNLATDKPFCSIRTLLGSKSLVDVQLSCGHNRLLDFFKDLYSHDRTPR
jgi:hypothetical protein